MQNAGVRPSRYELGRHGLRNLRTAYWNLGTAQLVEKAHRSGTKVNLARGGAFVVRTGQFTGRSPKDKYIVREPGTESTVDWGAVNQPMTEAQFDGLFERMLKFWEGEDVFVQDCFAGAAAGIQPAHSRDRAARLACAVRAAIVRPARSGKDRGTRAGIHVVFRSHVLRRSGEGRDALPDRRSPSISRRRSC